MKRRFGKRTMRLAAVTALLLALAGGVAYATIPGNGGVYTACMLNGVGTIRLIDPSLPGPNLMSHCTSKETQISWNEQGVKGDPGLQGLQGPQGATGADGKDGTDGTSVTSAPLAAGDSHCANGGAAFTAANGVTYACNGRDATNGGGATFVVSGSVPLDWDTHDVATIPGWVKVRVWCTDVSGGSASSSYSLESIATGPIRGYLDLDQLGVAARHEPFGLAAGRTFYLQDNALAGRAHLDLWTGDGASAKALALTFLTGADNTVPLHCPVDLSAQVSG